MHFPRIHKDEMRLFLFCAAAIIVVIGITTMITKYNSEGSVEEESLSEKEKSYVQELQKKVAKAEKNTFGPQYAPAQLAHKLFPFDPNHADSATLRKLGLSEWQTFNMMKYRRRGGRWRSPDDFKRLYGLSQADFERIRPYIRIAESDKRKPFVAFNERPYGQPVGEKPSYEKQEKLSEGTTVDINSADTTLLKKIPGIGSYYARKIVNYRERLGGFISVTQIGEIEGLPAGASRWFTVEERTNVKKLRINHAGFKELVRHPYLSYEQTKAIANHIRQYGPIHSLQELRLYHEFTTADLQRIAPYLRFD